MAQLELRDIPGYDAYQITRDGQVWSKRWGRWLKAGLSGDYPKVTLNGKQLFVHRLVLMAYVGLPAHDKIQGRHLDGNPSNCNLDNLAWGTQTENMADRRLVDRHGVILTNADVDAILEALAAYSKIGDIAKRFGIAKPTVSEIAHGTRWGWKSRDLPADRSVFHNTTLSDQQVAEIKSRYSKEYGEQSRLADEYGVSAGQISRILRGGNRATVDVPVVYPARRGKLLDVDAIAIAERAATGESYLALAKEFNVSAATISNVARGRFRKDLEAPRTFRQLKLPAPGLTRE